MVLLPTVKFSQQQHILAEIEKAGCDFRLLMLSDRKAERDGELPARNALFQMALGLPDWKYCVTISDDIWELPNEWGKKFIDALKQLPDDVGALNGYAYTDTFEGYKWAQYYVNAEGRNEDIMTPDTEPLYINQWAVYPPNPELSTACCIIKREVLQEVGLFDEGFGRGGGMEHWDYVIRMYRAGYQNLLTYKVRFKTHIVTGNNFAPNDTYTYYHKKWGTGLDGLPTKLFIEKARTTSPSAGFTDEGEIN